jgi:protein SCO1/2
VTSQKKISREKAQRAQKGDPFLRRLCLLAAIFPGFSAKSGSLGISRWFGIVVYGACGFSLIHSVCGQALSDSELAGIHFEQKPNTQLSLDLPFVDEAGREVRLGNYFGAKPVILVLGYYGCPMLCTLVLNGLVETMEDMKWRVGNEFEVVNVSINPQELPALAAAKKQSYLKRYGRAGAENGWHFLTGKEPEIQTLAQAVGFGYRLDTASKQYAHPSGLVILTPQGKVSRYLFGVSFSSGELYTALKEASSNKVSSPIQELILLCFHYNPMTGKYSPMILGLVRMLSAATVLGLVAVIVVSIRRTKAP